jgi:transposase-like protein
MINSISYKRHRFPSRIIAHAVWLYFRFPLSLRMVEEMLLERAIVRWGKSSVRNMLGAYVAIRRPNGV